MPRLSSTLASALTVLLLTSLGAQAAISRLAWGGKDGKGVDLYVLTNASGMEVRISNYGGIITSIQVPDRDGKMTNVTQGFDNLSAYVSPGYKGRYGAIVGRFANRIKDNRFQIGGISYRIGRGEGYTAGSSRSHVPYDERVWTAEARDGAEPSLVLKLDDHSGTMGFPGTVKVTATYTLTSQNVLRLSFRAVTDKQTPISLTNHAYFNLAGDASGPVLDHLLTVNADAITPGDASNTPTGEIRKVEGTAFDFRQPTPIGKNINAPDPLIQRAGGFDQNYALNGTAGTLRLAARLEDPKSGRVMEEWTTLPGLQVYTANYPAPLVGEIKGYRPHGAVALEAQGFPNAPNIPDFPSTMLSPNQTWLHTIEFRFSVK